MNDYSKNYPNKKSNFAADVLKLVSGTTFSQILILSITPVLTRLYQPDAFGTNSLFLSISNIIVMIACMRYQLAIMLPDKEEDAVNLLSLSVFFSIIISIVSGIAVFFWKENIAGLLNEPALSSYLWMVPLAVLFGGLFSALNNWNLRTRHFSRLAINRVVSSLVTATVKLTAGFSGYATGGAMIAANVTGSGLPAFLLMGQVLKEKGTTIIACFSWSGIQRVLKRYRQFLYYDTWSTLLNNVSWQLPAFLLSSFFSTSVVGYYSLGLNILRTPMGLVGQSISQVFFQRAAEARKEGQLASLVEAVFKRLVKFSLFPMLILTVIGREVFIFVCGTNWAEAGVYTEILSIWTFFWFISSPLSMLLAVLEKQKFNLVWNSFNFVTRFASLWIGGIYGSPRMALYLFSISGVMVYGGLCIKIMKESGVRWLNVVKIIGSNFLVFVPAGILLGLLKFSGQKPWVVAAVTGIILCFYGVYIIKTDSHIYNLVVNKIRKSPDAIKLTDID